MQVSLHEPEGGRFVSEIEMDPTDMVTMLDTCQDSINAALFLLKIKPINQKEMN